MKEAAHTPPPPSLPKASVITPERLAAIAGGRIRLPGSPIAPTPAPAASGSATSSSEGSGGHKSRGESSGEKPGEEARQLFLRRVHTATELFGPATDPFTYESTLAEERARRALIDRMNAVSASVLTHIVRADAKLMTPGASGAEKSVAVADSSASVDTAWQRTVRAESPELRRESCCERFFRTMCSVVSTHPHKR